MRESNFFPPGRAVKMHFAALKVSIKKHYVLSKRPLCEYEVARTNTRGLEDSSEIFKHSHKGISSMY